MNSMAVQFHLRRLGTHWDWRLIDDGTVLAAAPQTYPTRGEAEAAISTTRRTIGDADIVVDTTVPESRWRRIGPDGAIGEPVGDDPPDSDDEGETGPPEVTLGEPDPPRASDA